MLAVTGFRTFESLKKRFLRLPRKLFLHIWVFSMKLMIGIFDIFFWFACLSILEDISYTRKDGQYLRWDYRADRKLKSEFNKGDISVQTCDY